MGKHLSQPESTSLPSVYAGAFFPDCSSGYGTCDPAWLALILWILAPLVALARVAMGYINVSDVVAWRDVGHLDRVDGLQIL